MCLPCLWGEGTGHGSQAFLHAKQACYLQNPFFYIFSSSKQALSRSRLPHPQKPPSSRSITRGLEAIIYLYLFFLIYLFVFLLIN